MGNIMIDRLLTIDIIGCNKKTGITMVDKEYNKNYLQKRKIQIDRIKAFKPHAYPDKISLDENGYLNPDTVVYMGLIKGYSVYRTNSLNELCNWFVGSKSKPLFPLGVYRSQDDMEIMMHAELIVD